jgi:hypothetical protein
MTGAFEDLIADADALDDTEYAHLARGGPPPRPRARLRAVAARLREVAGAVALAAFVSLFARWFGRR